MNDGPQGDEAARGRFPLAAALAGALAVVIAARLCDRVVDDTFISLRYARNWAAGLGPVFNAGERVEGYTNFLWTALLAAIEALFHPSDLPRVAQWGAIACGAALAATTIAVVARRLGSGAAALAAALLALHSPLLAWSSAGLETTAFALLVIGGFAAELSGRRVAAPLLLALATMTRPDGIVFVVALLGARLLRLGEDAPAAGSAPSRGAAFRSALLGGVLFALVYAPYWLWRWRYYGWPVPNTFYAKVGGGLAQWKRGAQYVADWAFGYGVWIAPLAIVGAWRRRSEAWSRLAAAFLAAGLFYVVAVGGESLQWFRFMVPLAPFVALLAIGGARELLRFLPRHVALLAGAALAVATALVGARPMLGPTLFPDASRELRKDCGLSFPGDGKEHAFRWFDNYFVARQRVAAEWIDQHAPPDALVAATPAGAIGWYMRQPLLDMLGLNDEHIAHVVVPDMGHGRAGHEKGDGPYVLSRKPRFILLGNVAVFDHPLSDEEIAARTKLRTAHDSESQLWNDPAFHADYERRAVRVGESGPFQWFTFWERKAGR